MYCLKFGGTNIYKTFCSTFLFYFFCLYCSYFKNHLSSISIILSIAHLFVIVCLARCLRKGNVVTYVSESHVLSLVFMRTVLFPQGGSMLDRGVGGKKKQGRVNHRLDTNV